MCRLPQSYGRGDSVQSALCDVSVRQVKGELERGALEVLPLRLEADNQQQLRDG